MKRTGKGRGFNPHQFQLDWRPATPDLLRPSLPATMPEDNPPNAVIANQPTTMIGGAAAAPQPPERSGHPDLVQILPWDFMTTFPELMEDAIDSGIVSEDDAEPENLRAMHGELTRQLLEVLTDQDHIADARRRGVDPKTGGRPTSRGGMERLKTFFEIEPVRLERTWQALMGTYEAAFGEEAAAAFTKAIRARHAGIRVVTEDQPKPETAVQQDAAPAPPAMVKNTAIEDAEGFHVKTVRGNGRRVIARLPVPRPLAQAVAAGNFGNDERGPVNPSADEVREITENHAEMLIDLLGDQKQAERTGREADQVRISVEVQAAVMKYAEDFGDRAAEQLLAYCRRQSLINESSWNRTGHRTR
jgi:hypothetical protein